MINDTEIKNRIRGLDGLRGFAAIFIIAFHVAVLGGYIGQNSLFDRVIGRGDCFVRMFFMLSGFSLMCAYFKSFSEGRFNIGQFLKKRVIKIYPLFWIVCICHVIFNYCEYNSINIYEIIGSASMLFALFPSYQDSLVWGGWSMGIQVIFYLFFPVFMCLCKNKRSTWAALIVSFCLLEIYLQFYGNGIQNAHINILRQMIYFVAGALIFHYKNLLQILHRRTKIIVSLICVLLEIGCFLIFSKIIEDITILIAFSALIVLQILGFDYIMNSVIFCWLGKISYEIYLLHCVIYRLIAFLKNNSVFAPLMNFQTYFWHFISITVITIIASYFVNYYLYQGGLRNKESVK